MTTTRFHVPGMDCATEKAIISSRLARLDGLGAIDFDLLDRIVVVEHPVGAEAAVEAALNDIGMAPQRMDGTSTVVAPDSEKRSALAAAAEWTKQTPVIALAGACALGAEVIAWVTGRENTWPVITLAVIGILLSGPTTFRKGVVALRTLTLNINLLMTIAVCGALAIGQWPEAAMVTVLFAIAELIESHSVDRARNAIRSLMALSPETARVQRDGAWVDAPAADIKAGERLRILPGERVPLDGMVATGTTSIDQAPITGESVPVDKSPGDQVFAGTINQQGAIEVEVTAVQADSTLARIARTIRDAQSQQAPTERFVDKFARWYTPSVVLLALGIAIVPPLVMSEGFEPWIYKALVLLVIACPCALVISTPITIVSGLAAAARRGILVKGGVHLEQAARLRVIALDKTGTVTEGKPALTDVVTLGTATRDHVLQLAASLEATSTHPLAKAIVAGWTGELLAVSDAKNIAGKGVEGQVGSELVVVGSHRLAEERCVCGPDTERELARLESEGKSVMVVWSNDQVIGVLGVADVIRQTSVEAIKRLHRQGIKLAMLTGDNPTTANTIAKQMGIDEVLAELLPEDKLAAVERLTGEHGPVGMVGDGVNDAPALARAAVGFAMGVAGTDTAIETADIALMNDDLRGVPEVIALSQRVASTLKVNIGISIGVKMVFFALGLAGIATLWMAVFADVGTSLIVAANGLRLLRWKDTNQA